MPLSPKTVRAQLNMLLPLFSGRSLETLRAGQDKVGELMEARYRRQVLVKEHAFDAFTGAWVLPEDQRREGVVLYLHGGGYTCGSVEYAKGFGSMLAVQCGVRVFCAGYRLAPEHPFPAAVEDALESYRYLLRKGYAPEHIALCGESAGGGLCYSLCMRLRELGLPMPCGIIAISPWTDLTMSGRSYEENRERDPSMTVQMLSFFASHYTHTPKDPLASPLFGDLRDMPPSLIFVGGDEIMLSDSRQLHARLLEAGRESSLTVRPERWHGYVLYGLQEDREDMAAINAFLNSHHCGERKLRWMPLDNAAKIYPAAQRSNWSNVYRMSATLRENVDREVLQQALDVTVRRFPSIAARLRRGVFWYYLQQLEHSPKIMEESSFPLTPMPRREIRKCALRVIVYGKRIAVEFFHSLTDGTGALIFLKTLLAEYLQQKHGISVPSGDGVLGRLEEPHAEELEDSFPKYASPVQASRAGTAAWHPSGTPESGGFLHVTCMQVPVSAVLERAHSYGVSVNTFLGAAMLMALQRLQEEKVPDIRRRKPLKVLLPVNLRRLFPSKTLRNFALFVVPELNPRLGAYSFGEVCKLITHKMGMEANAKHMSTVIAANVGNEEQLALKLVPLFLKNIVMKAVFDAVGERQSSLCLSNLGAVKLPEIMRPYVQRFDFILGVQATSPYNCGVVSYGETMYINFIRNIRQPDLERCFFAELQAQGLEVLVESNSGLRED